LPRTPCLERRNFELLCDLAGTESKRLESSETPLDLTVVNLFRMELLADVTFDPGGLQLLHIVSPRTERDPVQDVNRGIRVDGRPCGSGMNDRCRCQNGCNQ
jgi:hypothetical protein